MNSIQKIMLALVVSSTMFMLNACDDDIFNSVTVRYEVVQHGDSVDRNSEVVLTYTDGENTSSTYEFELRDVSSSTKDGDVFFSRITSVPKSSGATFTATVSFASSGSGVSTSATSGVKVHVYVDNTFKDFTTLTYSERSSPKSVTGYL